MLRGRWDWIKTLHRELLKALFLVGALSKAVNAQMITDYMFPRNNRTMYFKKYICIMTLFLVGGISASRIKAALYLAVALRTKSFAIFGTYRRQKWRNNIM